MALITEPSSPYSKEDWLKKPKQADEDEGFDKYMYKNGENLVSIAATMSKPWRELTWRELTKFNWGTSTPREVNYYLKNNTGCTTETEDSKNYRFTEDDENPFVWVPKLEKLPSGLHRSPSAVDIGHVALDDDSEKHINTLVIRPVYTITIELGDTDALFDPIGDGRIWESKGLQQRLQVLGYLYTPLGHSNIAEHCSKCWDYYIKVHSEEGKPPPTPTQMLATLKKEVRNNILATLKGRLPTTAQILDGRLPQPGRPKKPAANGKPEVPEKRGEFGMIRFPGGYCFTYPRIGKKPKRGEDAPNDDDSKYDFKLVGSDRFAAEDAVWKDNELLGKIPLVATVERILPDGTREPAEGVAVYFQLIKPDELEDGDAVRAPDLRATEMDYAKDHTKNTELAALAKPAHWTDPQWDYVRPFAEDALSHNEADDAVRTAARDVAVNAADLAWRPFVREVMATAATVSAANQPPYEKGTDDDPYGPRRFLKDAKENQDAVEDADPQKDNVDKKYGGRRGLPVEGEGTGDNFKPGVFEVGKERQGLHSKRSDKHADYGDLPVAGAVEPTTERNDAGEEVKKHAYAVAARTNDKGMAGVIFTPSRIGGDCFKIRAYVGPESLEFAGDDRTGPVTETGTMVVWRNIRLGRYLRLEIPPQVGVSAAVTDMWTNSTTTTNTIARMWRRYRLADGMGTIDADPVMAANLPKRTNGADNLKYYRPVDVDVLQLEEQYNRCYCEFIIDARDYPEAMTDAVLADAITAAQEAAKESGEVAKVVDWNTLLFHDFTSPVMLNIREWNHYNTLIAAGPVPKPPDLTAGDMASVRTALSQHAAYALMESFSGGGVLPGLTIVHAARGDSWDKVGNPGSALFTSGRGMASRGCFLLYTNSTYRAGTFCYNLTANTAHELGHVLIRQHQRPDPGNGDIDTHQAATGRGVTPASDTCVCIMSYRGCYGEYCGRCGLALRGWHTKIAGHADGI